MVAGRQTIAYEAEVDGVVQIFTRTLGSAMRTQVTRSAFDCYGPIWSVGRRTSITTRWRATQTRLWQSEPVGGAPEIDDRGRVEIGDLTRRQDVFFLR